MKNKIPLFGLSALVVIATACTPLPYHPSQTTKNIPHYNQSSAQQRYIPSSQYRPPANYSSVRQARKSIVKLAYKQLGIRYKYGGSSPREGFDCSGLMNYLHKNGAGVTIPRTAAQQRDRSRSVRYADLQPGDLLFFKTGSKTNHVGVYVGNHLFIHAPNRRSKVKITTMDNAYWQRKFVKFGTFLES